MQSVYICRPKTPLMKYHLMKYYLLFLLGICLSISINAQDLKFDLQELDVVSSRISSGVIETGKNVIIINSEMIAEMPVNSVDELLRQILGIEIQSRGGFGVQSDMGIRGANYNQVFSYDRWCSI